MDTDRYCPKCGTAMRYTLWHWECDECGASCQFGDGLLEKPREEKPKGFGMRATVRHANGTTSILHNVTEVHYCYDTLDAQKRVAFESDIHGTGILYDVDTRHKLASTPLAAVEFEVVPETEIADEF